MLPSGETPRRGEGADNQINHEPHLTLFETPDKMS